MLNKSIRILNFDGSLPKQTNLLAKYRNEILGLEDLGPKARYWLNPRNREEVGRRISGSDKNSITFLGSGDFHHISEILISQFNEPLTVILFDFHPDWDTLPPRFGCGSWVSEVLKQNNVVKFIILGVSSDDLSSFAVQTGNLSSLKSDRVEIYPYAHQPSLLFLKKIPENISVKMQKGLFFNKLCWNELKSKHLTVFFQEILSRIPTKKVYLSIDKDCLSSSYALTNWEEGMLSLEALLSLLSLIKQNLDIIGLDITGEYSSAAISGFIKRIAAYFDHPKDIRAKKLPYNTVNSINENTNLEILKLLL